MALSKIKTGSITDSAITTAKIADGTILNADVSSGTTIDASKLAVTVTYPTISSISQDYIAPAEATSFNITGTGFTNNSTVHAISSTGAITTANSVTYNSNVSLTVNFTLASEGNYFLRVERNDGLAVQSSSALLGVNNDPTWQTTAGSLGSVAKGGTISFSAYATETDSGPITYTLVSGTMPTGASMATSNNIVYITGTENSSISSETTYTFSIEATDDESQKATREFSIDITHGSSGGGQFNG